MGCQELKVVPSLRYSGYLINTSCVCQVSFFSAHLDNKQKSFVPKKNLRHVAKGQLISKCPYEKSVWTKYQEKCFCPGSLLLQG